MLKQMIIFLCAFAPSFSAFSENLEKIPYDKNTRVYIGVSSPANGLSLFGHVFLIISPDSGSPLSGAVVSYSTDFTGEELQGDTFELVLSALNLYGYESKMLTESYLSFGYLRLQYIKNQEVVIYELSLIHI